MLVEVISADKTREIFLEAARICTGNKCKNDDETVKRLLLPHHQTLERLCFVTLRITGISRKAADQLVRHKGVNCLVSSTMYQKHSNMCCPPEVEKQVMKSIIAYNEIEGTDVASYAAPLGIEVGMLMAGPVWEIKHVIRARSCLRNTPEVTKIAKAMAAALEKIDPLIFSSDECDTYCMFTYQGQKCPETGRTDISGCKRGKQEVLKID